MSTRSRIGMLMPDGKVKSIYCHWDGYPEGVGRKLQKYYTTPEKVEELLSLGDISSLGDHYDEKISKADWKKFDLSPAEIEDFMEKEKNCTVAYKDRGDNSPARIDDSLSAFMSKMSLCGEEFVYIFEEDHKGIYEWHICETPWFENLNDYFAKESD